MHDMFRSAAFISPSLSRRNTTCCFSALHLQQALRAGGLKRTQPLSSKPASAFEGGPWHEKYLLLEEYKSKHGDCLVPSRYAVVADDRTSSTSNNAALIKLGVWVAEQRRRHKNGKLNANRYEMLDNLGFSWDPVTEKWEKNYALVEQYAEREGHANVPHDHVEDGTRLGRWLQWQRRNMREGMIDPSHADRLEALGVSWDPFVDQWEDHFELLRQFKRRKGHCNVPFRLGVAVGAVDGDGQVKLGHWLVNQRQLAKRNKLDADREGRLTRLGVRW